MSISFQLDPPIRYLVQNGEVYTLRNRQRPTGRQYLYLKRRKVGLCTVTQVDLAAKEGEMLRYYLWSGYPTETEWLSAAMNINGGADVWDFSKMGVFKVKIDSVLQERLKSGGERWL